jgi:hypothetical protein
MAVSAEHISEGFFQLIDGLESANSWPLFRYNNDCVIAHSYDAKPFVKMGAPYEAR